MIALGVDPGIAKFGYGCVRHERGTLAYVDAGVITTSPRDPVSERLAAIAENFEAALTRLSPDVAVVERLIPAAGRNLGAVMEVRGVVLLLLTKRGIRIFEESPKTVKALTTRHGSATKAQMRKTVQRLLDIPALPPADAADALALAILAKNRWMTEA